MLFYFLLLSDHQRLFFLYCQSFVCPKQAWIYSLFNILWGLKFNQQINKDILVKTQMILARLHNKYTIFFPPKQNQNIAKIQSAQKSFGFPWKSKLGFFSTIIASRFKADADAED